MGKSLRLIRGIQRLVDTNEDETIKIINGIARSTHDYKVELNIDRTILTGSLITIPQNKVYNGEELKVYLNDYELEYLFDYNYEGNVPRTQISLNFDLESGDRLRFKIGNTK